MLCPLTCPELATSASTCTFPCTYCAQTTTATTTTTTCIGPSCTSPFYTAPVHQSAARCAALTSTLQIFTKRLKKGVWDIRAIVDSGGMPSSHSALCAGITTAIAFQNGLGSSAFALAVAFSSIVMYDAAGVRRHAGKQAEVLNQVIDELLEGHPVSDIKLKEVLGHTPLQVGGQGKWEVWVGRAMHAGELSRSVCICLVPSHFASTCYVHVGAVHGCSTSTCCYPRHREFHLQRQNSLQCPPVPLCAAGVCGSSAGCAVWDFLPYARCCSYSSSQERTAFACVGCCFGVMVCTPLCNWLLHHGVPSSTADVCLYIMPHSLMPSYYYMRMRTHKVCGGRATLHVTEPRPSNARLRPADRLTHCA